MDIKQDRFFLHKGVRIKISEHFNKSGKPITEIIKEAVRRDGNTHKNTITAS